jgi:hypothetical protein
MPETVMQFLENLDDNTQSMLKNMMSTILSFGKTYIDYVRDFDGEKGFMFSGGSKMNDLMNSEKVMSDGHSGCSAAITMRNCQYMLQRYPINDIETGLYFKDNDDISIDIKDEGRTLFKRYDEMDNYNKKACDVWASKGIDEAVNYMTRGITTGEMSYSEMRERYG